jgi:DNA-binding SARP family transcriptional activator
MWSDPTTQTAVQTLTQCLHQLRMVFQDVRVDHFTAIRKNNWRTTPKYRQNIVERISWNKCIN